MNLTGSNIHVGDDETITVTVNEDATGNITITVNGKNYTAEIQKGKAVFKVQGLKSGSYEILATYTGDEEYMFSVATVEFFVSKVKPDVDVSSPDVKITEDGKVVVTLPNDATGTVTIEVDGKKYTTTVHNGQTVFEIPGLTGGDHKIKVSYSGDDKYQSSTTDSDIKVVDDDDNKDKHENQTHAKSSKGQKRGVDLTDYPTGNPILVLMLILIAVGCGKIRRFKK